MTRWIKIKNRLIGDSYKPLIIIELGINHNGNLRLAKQIIKEAKKSGAEIIKNQTHIPDMEMAPIAKTLKPGNSNKNIFEIIKKNYLSAKDERAFSKYVNYKQKIFLSTPF